MFFRKKKVIEVKGAVGGKTVFLENVPDDVFSSKMLGDGIAIEPTTDVVVAPIEGTVEMIAEDSKHAVGIRHESGLEIMIHIGLDTVELKGEGFQVLTQLKQKVKPGDPLIRFDQAFLDEKEYSVLTMMIVTNTADYKIQKQEERVNVTAGETTVFECVK